MNHRNPPPTPQILINQPRTDNTRQVHTHFVEQRGAGNPWLTVDSPQPRQGPVVRRIQAMPIPSRSISTMPPNGAVPKLSKAPFPSMPTKNEVLVQKQEIEQEIQATRAELSALQHQINYYDHSTHSLIPTSSGSGFSEYHNILLSDTIIESVMAENKEKKKKSTHPAFIGPQLEEPAVSQFKKIEELPLYKETIDDYEKYLAPLFYYHFQLKQIINDKQISYTSQYMQKKNNWEEQFPYFDEYAARVDYVSDNWPAEFPKGKTKPVDAACLKWVAPDQPLLSSNMKKEALCYYNMNGFVEDPQAEHDEFRNRVTWSEEEKKKFVSKYTQHPKKFRLIAESLPLKSVKDVVEFYYVNRFALSLKEKEGARRKRGGKAKVVSEGAAKKTT